MEARRLVLMNFNCVTKRTPEKLHQETGIVLCKKLQTIYNIIKNNPGISEDTLLDTYIRNKHAYVNIMMVRTWLDRLHDMYLVTSYWKEC